ncbi:hypothetical protein [Stutzerimonas xanthomarina]|uniref:hypothetical protein n=1 Tax=Stutzerimonas xanthomarina TaxID=271420 RepID=UPI003AA8502C
MSAVHDEALQRPVRRADGYRQMLDGDVRAIPDLQFNTGLFIVEPPHAAAQL